ncbi:glycoside hydrolase family 3 protein [Dictyobacter kobayashii]|uniref:beta-N-acetylhexosaminidase n=1 Tax=Dictyobacter kobayashii TaxID=2014872 RepID=A0A402AN51_9CHLR|nr:glycoside hydrolase family 3 N-terminal domain-containing protein [Dictyobacter kobayashii]GCE20512.1 hypothetical protein KDK_43120 [Dictyobacter kobayashii]
MEPTAPLSAHKAEQEDTLPTDQAHKQVDTSEASIAQPDAENSRLPPFPTDKESSSSTKEELSENVDKQNQIPVSRPDYRGARTKPSKQLSRKKAAGLILILIFLVWQAVDLGQPQFIGSQGWASILYPSNSIAGTSGEANDVLSGLTSSTTNKAHRSAKQPAITPQEYINLIVDKLSMDQKLGQMMMVQFVGATDGLQLSTMINQYQVGSVILFSANGNIIDKPQFETLTQAIRDTRIDLPISMAIDQEGGNVDRLQQLDGPRPSAAALGATNDIQKVTAAGIQDAQDLSSYGITLNLAPVVDVDNSVSSEMHQDMRTFGTTPEVVSRMAGAYLQGLQQSQKVVGTLKHFPGLGDATVDPHVGLPSIQRTKSELEAIDWAPYRTLIKQGQVHAIMVTHEIVPAIDASKPSSLSSKLVTGILRDEMGYQGVIMTDSLTMAGITAYYTPDQAAAMAIEAGSDIIMGAASPNDVAQMINGIKQALNNGGIQPSRIDESVRRILMMKYQMGLLPIPNNK